MNFKRFYEDHILDDYVARMAGFNPYYPEIQSGLDDPIIIDGHEFINLASNNYLGLSFDRRVIDAAIEGIKKYGVSMCATPIASGYSDLFREAEEKLSEFIGVGDSLIFPSCYQANNGLFQAIAGTEDLIIVDRFAHSSLIEGIKVVGCKYRPFRHNDLNHLEEILIKSDKFNQVFVVTESVFSTEGSIAPFKEINELCEKYDAIPVVDDSHGIGVIGETGKGILEHSGIMNYNGIYTASLGKAMATSGGMIGAKKTLIEFLRYSVSHLIYSTAILPGSLSALIMVIKIIQNEFSVMAKTLWDYSGQISKGLKNAGFEQTYSKTPIRSIQSGNSIETLKLTKKLFELGILTTPFIYPSVPESEGRIRLIAGANLDKSSIDYAIRCFSKIKSDTDEMHPHSESAIEKR